MYSIDNISETNISMKSKCVLQQQKQSDKLVCDLQETERNSGVNNAGFGLVNLNNIKYEIRYLD